MPKLFILSKLDRVACAIPCQWSLKGFLVASNALYSCFFVNTKRGKSAVESKKSLLQEFRNYLMRYCWAWSLGLNQAIYNIHNIQEFLALVVRHTIDNGSYCKQKVQKVFLYLFEVSKQQTLYKELLPNYIHEFYRICTQGFPPIKTIRQKMEHRAKQIHRLRNRNFIARLSKNQDNVFTFAFHQDMPFTNN